MILKPDYSEGLRGTRESLIELIKEVCPANLFHRMLRAASRLMDQYDGIKNEEAELRLRESLETAKLPLRLQLVREQAAKQQRTLQLLVSAAGAHCDLQEDLKAVALLESPLVDQILRKHLGGVKNVWVKVLREQTAEEDRDALRSALIEFAQDAFDECRDGMLKSAFPLKLLLELGSQIGVTYDDVGTTQPEIEKFLGSAE